MDADGFAWRLDDVAAYDVMQSRSHVLISLLIAGRTGPASPANVTEIAGIRAALVDLDPNDRTRVDALAEDLRLKIKKLES